MLQAEIQNQVLSFIKSLTTSGDGLTFESELVTSGVLDSIGIITMVGHIESSFGIQLAEEELVEDNFNTVFALSSLIASKGQKGPAAASLS